MKFRIVSDAYNGYEVQVRRWWFPFWIQCACTNTHPSLEIAKEYIKGRGVVYWTGRKEELKAEGNK